jgi:hypothetical protein
LTPGGQGKETQAKPARHKSPKIPCQQNWVLDTIPSHTTNITLVPSFTEAGSFDQFYLPFGGLEFTVNQASPDFIVVI